MAKEAIFIIGAIAVGIAAAGSLFLMYPDLMLRNTGLNSQGTAVPVIIDLNDPTSTASIHTTCTNSTTIPQLQTQLAERQRQQRRVKLLGETCAQLLCLQSCPVFKYVVI